MARTFRLKKSFLYEGILGSVFSLVVSGVYVGFSLLQNPAAIGLEPGSLIATVLVIGAIIFGSMLIGSIYMWVAYNVERLTIQADTVSLRSVTQDHQFDFSEVEAIVWPVRQTKRIAQFFDLQIHIPGHCAKLGLLGYSNEDRLEIIRIFRSRVPDSRQNNWPTFCQQTAVPLRDGYIPNADVPDSEQLQRDMTRRKQAPIFVMTVTLAGIFSIPLLVELGVDKLTSIIIGTVIMLIGVFGFIPFLPRTKTSWSTKDEALAMQLWDEGELASPVDWLVEE